MESNVLAIAGASCSGKSTLFESLKIELGDRAAYVSFDNYFVGVNNVPDISKQDWEDPNQTRYDDYCRDIKSLKEGHPVRIESKAREHILNSISDVYVEPKSLIITEGYLVLWSIAARQLIDQSIFLDVPESVMIARRIKRARSLDPWDTDSYIKNDLPIGYRKYVLPQREFADKVVDGTAPAAVIVQRVINFMRDANLL